MADMQPLVQTSPHHVEYINEIFTNFISGIGDYLRTDLFPRAKDTVIATNSKAVEMVRKRKNLAGENWSPKFPFLVVQPNMDIRPESLIGRLYHNYPNYNARFASKLFNPKIYQDDNVYISTALNRYVGSIDCTLWCSSVFEAIDTKMRIYQMFRGAEGSVIYPRNFECLIVIPDILENYEYENLYTNENYTLDWSGNEFASNILIKNLNQEKLCYPVYLRPYIKLLSIDDNTEPYGGGGDSISDHRVTVNIEWECSIPTHLILVEYKMPKPSIPISLETFYSFKYIENPMDIEEYIEIPDDRFNISLMDTTGSTSVKKTLTYNSAENYIITSSDVSSFVENQNLIITPSYSISDSRYVKAHSKYGYLDNPIHFDIDSSGDIVLYGQNLKRMEEDDIITFIYYQDLDFT